MDERIMTELEAAAVSELYRRERDEMADRLFKANVWCAVLGDMVDREVVKRIMQRPGVQNGLQKIEKWN